VWRKSRRQGVREGNGLRLCLRFQWQSHWVLEGWEWAVAQTYWLVSE